MPVYLHPGVYVEEVDAGPKPIEGVSTSMAGAVGVTARGPDSGKPLLVTSFGEFERAFGSFLPRPSAGDMATIGEFYKFPLSVKGFFDNGGQQMFIKRVVSAGADAATGTLGQGVVSEVIEARGAGATSIKVRTLVGIDTASTLRIVKSATGALVTHSGGTQDHSVASYDGAANELTLGAGIDQALGLGDLVVVYPIAAASNSFGTGSPVTLQADSVGSWGNDVRVRVRPSYTANLAMVANPNFTPFSLAVTPTPSTSDLVIDASQTGIVYVGDSVEHDGTTYTILSFSTGGNSYDTAGGGSTATVDGTFGATPGSSATVTATANAIDGTDTVHVRGAGRMYPGAWVELDNGTAKELFQVLSVAGSGVTLDATVAGTFLAGGSVRLIEAEAGVQYIQNGEVATEELYENCRLNGSLDDPDSLVSKLSRSAYVDAASSSPGDLLSGGTPLSLFPIAADGMWQNLSGGDDDYGTLTVNDFVGKDGGSGNRTGIAALEDIDEVSIMLAPGIHSPVVHDAMIIQCENLKDRFAIIDPPANLNLADIQTFRAPIDTKYAAMYYPYLKVLDPLTNKETWMAPSGHCAGVYARTDTNRGVHKAPANEVVRGITGLNQDINSREQDILNPQNINCIRFFPGRGNRIWGARCLTSDGSWKYIPVRRLFIFVEESIEEGTQWVVFEPNDEPLWARIRLSLTNFLTSVWLSGALQGGSPAEAFFVKCDRTTMTQDDIDNGRLICLIGIAPVKPAEFVIFRIQQKTIDS